MEALDISVHQAVAVQEAILVKTAVACAFSRNILSTNIYIVTLTN